ncbi:MAG: hypothetical protein KDB88_10840 [Flavobacteriales bacterium]|nr:hypothetical protein [Flavobacteriales bacterium]
MTLNTMRSTFLSLLALPTLCFAQWTPLNSGFSSSRSMTSQNGALYVATYTTGVRKSTDNGASWTLLTNGLPQSGGSYFVQSVGSNATHLFAGTTSGIYASDDAGASWSSVNGSLPASTTNYANKLFTFGNQTFAVFSQSIASGGGVYRTSNNGGLWNVGHSGMSGNAVVNHITSINGTLYAATSIGLFTSTDQGQSWTAFSAVNYATYGIAASGNNLIITSVFGYRWSSNGGATWNDASGDPASPTDGELIAFDGKLYALSGTSNACFRSVDDGQSWSAFNAGFSMIDAGAQEEFHVSGSTLFCTALFDVYKIEGMSTGLLAQQDVPAAWIHPSIVQDGFNVVVPDGDRNVLLQLFDVRGMEVMRVTLNDAGAQWISRGSLACGTYTYTLRSMAGNAGTGRLLVQ